MTKKLTISMTPWEAGLCWCYWAFQLLLLPVLLQFGNSLLQNPLSPERLNFLFFALNFLALTVFAHRFLLSSTRQALHHLWKTLHSAGVAFAVYYVSMYLIGLFIGWVSPQFSNANDSTVHAMLDAEPVLTAVGTVFLVPVAEEIMYRGLIFRTLHRRSRLVAYGVSSLVFALIHILGYVSIYDPLAFGLCLLQYLPAGLCLAWAYERSNTIWAPILIHISVNQMGLMSMR